MGKSNGSSSWLAAVKRAFRSTTKQSNKSRDNEKDAADDEKKREKRRWTFRKQTYVDKAVGDKAVAGGVGAAQLDNAEQSRVIAVAVATAAAAEAAVATAQAAVEVARLTRPTIYAREQHYAAIVIQTAFRGHLARSALCALRGLVKLQALVRGHNVRKQAKMTLQCMQALVRVQAQMLEQRVKLPHDHCSWKSTFSFTASLMESRCQNFYDRRSMSRDGISIADDWDDKPHTIEEVKAMLMHRKEVVLKCEKALRQTFSQQRIRNGRSASIGNDRELHETPQRLDRWIATKPWDNGLSNTTRPRASLDQRESIKMVEIDTSQPYSYVAPNSAHRRSITQTHYQYRQQSRPSSPLRRPGSPLRQVPQYTALNQFPSTPSPAKIPSFQVRSSSPCCSTSEEKNYANYTTTIASQTPSLQSNYNYTGNLHGRCSNTAISTAPLPNYMAATESAKARLRSQSAPKQRLPTPRRDQSGSAKKRLSYPAPEPYLGNGGYGYCIKSPSFKSNVSGPSHLLVD